MDVIGFTVSDKKRFQNEIEKPILEQGEDEFEQVEEEDEEVVDEVLNKEHQAGFTNE